MEVRQADPERARAVVRWHEGESGRRTRIALECRLRQEFRLSRDEVHDIELDSLMRVVNFQPTATFPVSTVSDEAGDPSASHTIGQLTDDFIRMLFFSFALASARARVAI